MARDFERDKERVFDAYCKKVMRNAARDIRRRSERQRRRELAYADVPPAEACKLGACDDYFATERFFAVPGADVPVVVRDADLADVLAALDAQSRAIVLLSYYLDKPDGDIGLMLGMPRSTVQRRRTAALLAMRGALRPKEVGG